MEKKCLIIGKGPSMKKVKNIEFEKSYTNFKTQGDFREHPHIT